LFEGQHTINGFTLANGQVADFNSHNPSSMSSLSSQISSRKKNNSHQGPNRSPPALSSQQLTNQMCGGGAFARAWRAWLRIHWIGVRKILQETSIFDG